MRAARLILALALALAACSPRPEAPPKPDSTAPDSTPHDPMATPDDTLQGLDSAAVSDTTEVSDTAGMVAYAQGAASQGLVLGLSGWRDWCSGPFTGGPIGVRPNLAGGLLRAAHRCGARLALVYPRNRLTTNGRNIGRFCPECHKRLSDELARALPNDTLAKYTANGTLLYFSILDDLGSEQQWGGQTINMATAADVTCYAQRRLGAAPIGIRQTAAQLAGYRGWNNCVDVTVAQWHKKRGDQKQYYDKARAAMDAISVERQIYSVNVHDCGGQNSPPCTPSELRRYVEVALRYPGSYGFIGWKLDTYALGGDYRNAWTDLAALARSLPTVRF